MAMKIVIALGVGLVGTEIVWQLWTRVYSRRLKALEQSTISEVLLFTDDCSNCREHANTRIPCGVKCPVASVKRIVDYLDASTTTLEICMYLITSQDVSAAISRARKRNVHVRMIVDAGMAENPACAGQIMRIQRSGVQVLSRRSTISLMHHKLAIIDQKILIYGSTNWTMQAFYGNSDGIIVTNQRVFVQPFLDEFNRMWEDMNQRRNKAAAIA